MALAYSFRLACDCLNVVKSIQIEIYGQVILEIIVRKADFRSVEFVQVIRNPADGVCNIYKSSWLHKEGAVAKKNINIHDSDDG